MGCAESRVGIRPTSQLPAHIRARASSTYGLRPHRGELADDAEYILGTVRDPDDAAPHYYRTRTTASRPIAYAGTGLASKHETPSVTLIHALRAAASRHPHDAALVFDHDPATERHFTWSDYNHQVTTAAKALLALVDLQPGDVIIIDSFNTPAWFVAALGTVAAGGVFAGAYSTDAPAHVAHKTRYVGARVVFVDNEDRIDRNFTTEVLNTVPSLRFIVAFDNGPHRRHELPVDGDRPPVGVLTWTDFLLHGVSSRHELELERRVAGLSAEKCAALVFTSGATGPTKAVMLTHDNLCFEARAVLRMLPAGFGEAGQERALSYLPLSHVAALMLDLVAPLYLTADCSGFGTTYFAQPTDVEGGNLGARLRRVRPTIFIGVPRVYDVIAQRAANSLASRAPLERLVANVATAQSLELERNMQMGGSHAVPLLYNLANDTILRRVRAALGLDACKFALSAVAPISLPTLRLLASLGVAVHEAYGASESCGIVTMTRAGAELWGSVGPALPGCEVRVLKPGTMDEAAPARDLFAPTDAEKGELCFRGRNVMLGYAESADGSDAAAVRAKNAETLLADGWCRSGDVGVKDARGLVRVLARYQDMITTASGEAVAPAPVEEALMNAAPAVSRVVLLGEGRPFVVALITLKQEGANGVDPGTGELSALAKAVSAESNTTEAAMDDPQWVAYLDAAVTRVNADAVACPNPAAHIKKYTVLPRDFCTQNEELTPTFRVKRRVVEVRYAVVASAMFDCAKVADELFLGAPEPAYVRCPSSVGLRAESSS